MACRSVSVAPPSLAERSTDGFRVGDVRSSIGDFSTRFAMLLAKDASGSSSIAPVSDLDASDLRLETIEEALDLAGAAPQPAQPAQQQSNGNGGGRASSSGQASPRSGGQAQDHFTADPAPSPTLPAIPQAPREYATSQREKFRALTTVQSEVAGLMDKKEVERKEAVRVLRSLRALGPEGVSSRLAAPKRSFTELATTPAIFSSLDVKDRAQQDQPQPPSTSAISSYSPAAAAANDTLVPDGEVVIHVAVHLPQTPAQVSEEWLVLGSQRLTELRDAIFCLAEANLRSVEREENQRRPADQQLTLTSPSAYFYIEGTFYVDRRSPGAVDYSEVIRNYAQEHGMKAPLHPPPGPAAAPLSPTISDFTMASMHDTRVEDAWLRLGSASPGLFCHQGGCEHLLVFKDVRAHDPAADPPLLRQYPAKVADPGTTIAMRRQCEACGLRPAKKVTYEDRCAPQSPFFWCSDCFNLMHYDAQGRAVYMDFRVFPYQGEYQAKQLKRG